jgi:hypothetical protein
MTDPAYQVDVSLQVQPHDGWTRELFERGLRRGLVDWLRPVVRRVDGLTVHTREIGAQGESSVIEGEGP